MSIAHHKLEVVAVFTQGLELAAGEATSRYIEKTIRDAVSTIVSAMYDTTKNASAALRLGFTQKPELIATVHRGLGDSERRTGPSFGLEGLASKTSARSSASSRPSLRRSWPCCRRR